jgi:hypothetical protein
MKTFKRVLRLFLKCFANVSAVGLMVYLILLGGEIMSSEHFWWVGVIVEIFVTSCIATQAIWVAKKF